MKDLLTVHLPFGEPRVDVGLLSGTDKTYTSQRDMPGTGLMDYHARAYDPWLGRFIQPDTIVPGAANPQSWNRYSYVANAPMRFTDPSGNKPCDEEWGCEGKGEINFGTTVAKVIADISTKSGELINQYGVVLPKPIGMGRGPNPALELLQKRINDSPNARYFVTGFDKRMMGFFNETGEYSITRLGKGWMKSLGRLIALYDPITMSLGYVINISPNLIENTQNHYSGNHIFADLVVDTGGFLASEISEKIIGKTRPGLGLIVGVSIGAIWDDIARKENWSGKITYHYNQVDVGLIIPAYEGPTTNMYGATH